MDTPTPSAIQQMAAQLGHNISSTQAAGMVLCVAGKMLMGKSLMQAVSECLQ